MGKYAHGQTAYVNTNKKLRTSGRFIGAVHMGAYMYMYGPICAVAGLQKRAVLLSCIRLAVASFFYSEVRRALYQQHRNCGWKR